MQGGTIASRAAMSAAMGVGLPLSSCFFSRVSLTFFYVLLQTVAKIMGNPFALGGIVGDGKRPEDSDKVLNKIEYYPEFDVRFCSIYCVCTYLYTRGDEMCGVFRDPSPTRPTTVAGLFVGV